MDEVSYSARISEAYCGDEATKLVATTDKAGEGKEVVAFIQIYTIGKIKLLILYVIFSSGDDAWKGFWPMLKRQFCF